jgi:transposase
VNHLGIVSGLIDAIGIVEFVNEKLGEDTREQVSAGTVVKAMLLNGLGFVSAPLYLFEQFFKDIALEHLLGMGVKAEHLNDDRLGKVMDKLYAAGLSELFLGISLQAVHRFGVRVNVGHLDSTSFHLHGEYATEDTAEPQGIEITYGYSRDHRPDLKQFVMNLVCSSDGDIPLWLEMGSGNQSDKAKFAELMQAFAHQWSFEGLCVADSALYSASNLQAMSGLKWLTRVPQTLKLAQECLDAAHTFSPSTRAGYRIAETQQDYGGIPQRWIVVESEARRQSDLEQLMSQLETFQTQAQQKLTKLGAQEFACEADALNASRALSDTLPWHQFTELTAQPQSRYARRGKPAATDTPRTVYLVSATLTPDQTKVDTHHRRAGRFILATNVLDPLQLSAEDILTEYKNQQSTERGFRFLKDPLFFASSVFLKTPRRIETLGMLMALCLMVYTLGQRQLRQALAQQEKTIPNQLGKPTDSPTLRWVFQCFLAVHLVTIAGVKRMVNLTPERLHILQVLPQTCRSYYLLPPPVT